MTSEELLQAIGKSNSEYLQEVLDHMDGKNRRKTGKVLPRIILIAAVVALLAVTAYAARQYFGIMDFPGTQLDSLPSQAEEMIETRTEEGSQEGISYRLKETLTDGGQIIFVIEVKTNEPEKYFLVPEMIFDEESVGAYGLPSDLSLKDYTAQTGLTPLHVNARIHNTDELGIAVQSSGFWALSNDTAELKVSCNAGSLPEGGTEVECSVTASPEGGDMKDVIRGTLRFPLKYEAGAWEEYAPKDPKAVDRLTIQKAEVRQTELYTYIKVYYSVEGEDDLIFRVPGKDFREGSGGLEPNCYTIIVDRLEPENGITVEVVTLSDKSVLGTVTFTK